MTLTETKNYLRIDADMTDDDAYLNELLIISQNYIDKCCGTDYKTDTILSSLANLAQLKIIADMYNNRSQYVEKKIKQDNIISSIFDMLSC